jgi:hypothetical protein
MNPPPHLIHIFSKTFLQVVWWKEWPTVPAEYYSQNYGGGSPKKEGSILKYRVKRRTTFAKAYGTKVRCYGKTCWGTQWELKWNLMGTHWELKGNTLGTREK